jgi:zinc-binding in reverse transcriptase
MPLTINQTQTHNLSFYINDILKLLPIFTPVTSSDSSGTLNWKLTAAATFSAKSVYDILNEPSIHSPQFVRIWKIQVLSRIRFSIWFLLYDKLNTADNLLHKGWPVTPSCVMCSSQSSEDAAHLFNTCSLSQQLHTACLLPTQNQDRSMMDSWTAVVRAKQEELWATIMWILWKERNSRIFRGLANTLHRMTKMVWEYRMEWHKSTAR